MKTRQKCFRFTTFLLTSFAVLQSNSVFSQNNNSGNSLLEEVVVTARYKEENLQTAPIAISSLSAGEIDAKGLNNVEDLGLTVPNLYTHPGDSVWGPTPTISMRGVTASEYSFALEPAVGVYVDGVYHSTLVNSGLDIGDIERVEVRRGPQGTLAGNASIAGTISIHSKMPQGDDTGYFEATYGSRNEVNFRGGYDMALTSDLYLRVSGVSRRQDGYVDQLDFRCEMERQGTPELAGTFPTLDRSAFYRDCKIGEFGGTSFAGVKGILRWIPSDDLEISFLASHTNHNDQAPAQLLIETVPTPNDGFDQVISDAIFAEWGVVYDHRFLPPPGKPYSSFGTFNRPLNGYLGENSQKQDSTDFSLNIDYDLNDYIHLKGIFAYSDHFGEGNQVADVSPLGYVQNNSLLYTTQKTAEIRANGSLFDNRLDWVVGTFIFNSKNNLKADIDFITIDFRENDHFVNDSQSGFMHLDYALTDRISLSAGARYSNVKKTASLEHPPLLLDTVPFTLKDTQFEWLASAEYQFTDDFMAYASVTTGSRPAGITTIVNTRWQLSEYPAEELTNYEIGFKSEWFDRRARLNVAAFYSDYSKRLTREQGFECLGEAPPPTRVLDDSLCPPGGAVGWLNFVATPATVTGVEWELAAEPINGMLVNWSGGYHNVDNDVTTPGEPGYTVPGHIPQPELNMSGGIQYDIYALNGIFTPRVDWFYTSEQSFNRSSSFRAALPYELESAHSIFNAQLRYVPDNSKWTAILQIRNLTDKFYYHTRFDGSSVAIAGVVAEPREWSFTLRRDF